MSHKITPPYRIFKTLVDYLPILYYSTLSYTWFLSSNASLLLYFHFHFSVKERILCHLLFTNRNESQNKKWLSNPTPHSDIQNTRNIIKPNHSTILPFHTHQFSLRMLLCFYIFHFHFEVEERRIPCYYRIKEMSHISINDSQNTTPNTDIQNTRNTIKT